MNDIYTDMNSHLEEWVRPQELPDPLPEYKGDLANYQSKKDGEKSAPAEAPVIEKSESLLPFQESGLNDVAPILTVSTFVILVSILGFLLIRFKRSGKFLATHENQRMKISQTLSLGPKRHLILLSIGEKEIVLGNHENGMNFLFDNSPHHSIAQGAAQNKVSIVPEAIPTTASPLENGVENTHKPIAKPKFPKYLADSFEKEKNKGEQTGDVKIDNVENITNMIRQKLRDMKKTN